MPPRLTAAVFLLPFSIGILRQLLWPKPWFDDIYASFCAGDALLHELPIYAPNPDCPFSGDAFVYTPIWAQFCARLQWLFGIRGEMALYSVLEALLLLGLLAVLLRGTGLRTRAPFLAGLSASAFRTGNLSCLMHTGIMLTAWRFAARPALLFPPIVLAGCIKPTFAVYTALFLFTSGTWWRRVLRAGTAFLCIGAYYLYFRLQTPDLFNLWMSEIQLWGLRLIHGHGFFGMIALAGITDKAAIYALYAVFSAAILGCGLIAASPHTPSERLMVGVAICVLLYPRLLNYDQLTLPLGLGLLSQAGGKPTQLFGFAIGIACLVTGGGMGGHTLYLASCALLIWRAASVWRTRNVGRKSEAPSANALSTRITVHN